MASSSPVVTYRIVVIILAAFGALGGILGFGSQWIYYSKIDGKVLEKMVEKVQADNLKMSESLNTLATTINAVLVQQAKQTEAILNMTQILHELKERK